MSEHKTNSSNWTPDQKKSYRERREHGLRGQAAYVVVTETLLKKGKAEIIPISTKYPPRSNRYHSRPPLSVANQRKVPYIGKAGAVRS